MSGDFPKTRTRAPSTISSCACASTSKKTRPSRVTFLLCAGWAIALSLSPSANISGAGFERIFARGCQTILLRFDERKSAKRCHRWKAHHHVSRLNRRQLRDHRRANHEVKNEHGASGIRAVAPRANRREANVRKIQDRENRGGAKLRWARAPLLADRPKFSR